LIIEIPQSIRVVIVYHKGIFSVLQGFCPCRAKADRFYPEAVSWSVAGRRKNFNKKQARAHRAEDQSQTRHWYCQGYLRAVRINVPDSAFVESSFPLAGLTRI
jgi:hypothetical protein